jgi:hypothetical protein
MTLETQAPRLAPGLSLGTKQPTIRVCNPDERLIKDPEGRPLPSGGTRWVMQTGGIGSGLRDRAW